MLQAIRDRATGIVAWVIIGMLVLGFVFWQIGDYLGIGGDPFVAEVNGERITQNQFLDNYSRTVAKIRKELDEDAQKRLRESILDGMVQREVVAQASQDAGYYVDERLISAKLRGYQFLYENGKFSQARYRDFLNSINYSAQEFQDQMARNTYLEQFESGVVSGEFLTRKETRKAMASQYRKIDLGYFRVPATEFESQVKVDDQILKDYYRKNIKNYRTDERVKLAYVEIRYRDLIKNVKVDEAKLKALYEKRKAAYRTAPIRKASHIFFKLGKKADAKKVAAVQKKALDVYKQLQKGSSFKKLLKKHSDDKLSPNGDLGVIDAKASPKLYKAIEKLAQGKYSKPVRSDSGIHILQVTLAKPGKIKTYEQARVALVNEYKKREANKAFKKASEDLQDLAVENSESLDVAAEKLGLKVKETDWIMRAKNVYPGIAKHAKVKKAAFSKEVFADGDPGSSNNSFLIEVNAGKPTASSVIVRLKKYVGQKPKAFDTVKAQVKKDYLLLKTSALAKKKAETLLKTIRAGKKMQDVAKENKYKTLTGTQVTRHSAKYARPMVTAAFRLGVPKAAAKTAGTPDKKADAKGKEKDKAKTETTDGSVVPAKVMADAVAMPNGDMLVFQLTKSTPGTNEKMNKRVAMFHQQIMLRFYTLNIMDTVINDAKSKAKIRINRSAIFGSNEN